MNDLALSPQVERFEQLRQQVDCANGPVYWRSLEQLAETSEFQEFLHREFPLQASQWHEPLARRDFLALMAAGLALAGVTGCTRAPVEKIVPYVRAPEQLVPGKPLIFATAMTLGGYAMGLLVESHLGRPTKIEGNPDHPASLGATNAIAQASILGLYDPDRSQTIMHRGTIETWDGLLTALAESMQALRGRRGAGLRILSETITSPSLAEQIQSLLRDLPEARWHQYEPLAHHNARAGAAMAFGEPVETLYRFDQADTVLSLDADFLGSSAVSVRYARDFIDRRRVAQRPTMSRLYAVESTPTLVGAMADHRIALSPGQVEAFAYGLARELGVSGVSDAPAPPVPRRWLEALLEDLRQGTSIIVPGEAQPPAVHALAHAMNAALGNVGRTVVYTAPVEANPVDQRESLAELVRDMDAGRVEMLVMLQGNPVYNAPGHLEFDKKLRKVGTIVHLSEYYDETSFLSHWHVPAAHYLESWSDARAPDGTASIVQPLIAPLYGGRTAHDLVAALRGQSDRSTHDLIQDYWRRRVGGDDFATQWQRWLHDGIVPATQAEPRTVALSAGEDSFGSPQRAQGLQVVFRADPSTWDGRFANNGWLQELPRPLTKIVWDNAAYLSFATAKKLDLASGDVVELTIEGRRVEAPVWIQPAHADDTVTLTLGYGRTQSGRIGTGIGYSAYGVLPAGGSLIAGAELRKLARRHPLVTTQDHWSMEGRDLVKVGTFDDYTANPRLFEDKDRHAHELPSLYPEYEYAGNAWGMVIDQTACIGCNACVVACQAENNIPVVGREQVAVGREMHWLRIDRYYEGEVEDPETYFQPMLCMHCEKAPCEVVCPVAATVHDSEGLNNMVYNRCVGTRYCSNNCPYKVRRFNFLQYTDETTESLKLMRNPNVTVRSRGVMEKCTYCVQRINAARIDAKKDDNRPIRDGEIVTACQAACPTIAITFGNINDRQSQVRRLKQSPLNYGLLAELNTQPRTSYLARIRNPHPSLAELERREMRNIEPSGSSHGEVKS